LSLNELAAGKYPAKKVIPGSDLVEATRIALCATGPLARADAAFVEREVQQRLAQAVAGAVEDRATLVAEAGTGVGKTFAYLVPLLLAQRRALISTATKSLQDQLFLRDLPRLKSLLGVPARIALLKGRGSYLCLHRLEQARIGAVLPDRSAIWALSRIEQWAHKTRTGDLSEVDGLDDRASVIPIVTSTRDNCLGADCPRYRDCHVMKARRDAMAADLVVVNHHLFFADVALRDSGVAELLPTVDAVVFDEAHQVIDTGLQFLGQQLATGALIDFCRDLQAAGLQHAKGLMPWVDLAGACERSARDLRLAAAGALKDLRGVIKLRWEERATQPEFVAAMGALNRAMAPVCQALAGVAAVSAELARLAERADAIVLLSQGFMAPCGADKVRWIDVGPREARLVESPLHVRDIFTDQRGSGRRAWIFTSATLGDDDASTWFCAATALEDARKLRVGSPFDYPTNARLWVPRQFPKPAEATHPAAVGRLAALVAQRLNGRTFVLTTTLRVLPLIADAIVQACSGATAPIAVLVQGREPKRALLQRFLAGGSVLVGSQSFWEGIDIAGDALQCVIIDKLPFPPPGDPLVQARSRQVEMSGGNAFEQCHLPDTAVSLKQGAGRLIRGETDRGLLVIADSRMATMSYGKRLRRALPAMTDVATEDEAMRWLEVLAAAHAD
jgi:ATP-dependent DNA helicase DinG